MIRAALLRVACIVGLMLATRATAVDTLEVYSHPAAGSLMIVGGGDSPDDAQRRFVALAGGPGTARIAILPMASREFDEEANEVMEEFRGLGAQATIINLTRRQASEPDVAADLAQFGGFWFTGGDQSRLARMLVGTSALSAIAHRYQEGAAIGGTSAGASVMSSLMLTGRSRRPRSAEEAETVNIARGITEVSMGFGFMKGAIIDQHFMLRPRYNRLLSAVLDHPHLVGVGIDEETALLVRPDGVWEVLGRNYVKIFDARRATVIDDEGPLAKASNLRMHVLPAGSTYDVRTRRVSFARG